MRRSLLILAMLMTAALLLAACGGSDDGDDGASENTEPTTAETPETEPSESESEATATTQEEASDSSSTPEAEGTPSARRIEPHELVLSTDSGEQSGRLGPYFWTNEELELAAEVQGGYYERHDEPLEVAQGEEVSIQTPADDFPTEITLEVFPPTEPNDAGLVTMEPEPLETKQIDPESATWTVELEPGDHYIELETVWPTNEVWGRMREVTYRYWISVTE